MHLGGWLTTRKEDSNHHCFHVAVLNKTTLNKKIQREILHVCKHFIRKHGLFYLSSNVLPFSVVCLHLLSAVLIIYLNGYVESCSTKLIMCNAVFYSHQQQN